MYNLVLKLVNMDKHNIIPTQLASNVKDSQIYSKRNKKKITFFYVLAKKTLKN